MTKFAHLSDLHILKEYRGDMLLDSFSKGVHTPVESLKSVLSTIASLDLDFVLITGDTVHEGNGEDYKFLKELLEEYLQDIPYLMVMGNHDRIDGYKQGFGEALTTGDKLFYSKEIKGLNVIVLDSGYTNDAIGSVDQEQLDFLKDELRKPMQAVIAIHHPLCITEEGSFESLHCLKNSGAFIEAMNRNVVGVFSGHTHTNKTVILENALHCTTGSLAFGFEIDNEFANFTDDRYYSLASLDNDELSVNHVRHVTGKSTFGKINIAELIKFMKEQELAK